MAFVVWKDAYEVGVASVDQQHQKLFSLLNALAAHVRDAAPKMDVERGVSELEEYAGFHFRDEERVLMLSGVEVKAEHMKQHSYFMTEVAKLRMDLSGGKAVDPLQLVGFLRDWLVQHILVVDRGAFEERHPVA